MSNLSTTDTENNNEESDGDQLDTLLQITDNDIEQALADNKDDKDGEEEEIYFDAITTGAPQNDSGAMYEDVDIFFNKRDNNDSSNLKTASNHDDSRIKAHVEKGIYDTSGNVNAPACMTPSFGNVSGVDINQFGLVKKQESACLPADCQYTYTASDHLHGDFPLIDLSTDDLQTSETKTILYDSANIYDLAVNLNPQSFDLLTDDLGENAFAVVKDGPAGNEANKQAERLVYDLAQNVTDHGGQPHQQIECGIYNLAQNVSGELWDRSTQQTGEQGDANTMIYDLAQNVTCDLWTGNNDNGNINPQTEINIKSENEQSLVYDLTRPLSGRADVKNAYDPAWTDSIFNRVPASFPKGSNSSMAQERKATNDVGTEAGLTKTGLKNEDENKLYIELDNVEHKYLSESGNYDRLVLRQNIARKNGPASSSYGVIDLDSSMLPSDQVKDSSSSSLSKPVRIESKKKSKHNFFTRKRKGTKLKTPDHNATAEQRVTEDQAFTTQAAKEDQIGTEDNKSDTISFYTDVTDPEGTVFVREEDIYEPIGPAIDFDSDDNDDDDGWSSSEFEEYEEDEENRTGSQPKKPLPPPPDKGGGKPEKHRFIQRISSFRNKSEVVEEEGPILPLKINQTKHPPAVLPKTPPHLSQIQTKKRLVIGCIIDSEKSYIESLERVTKEYKEPLLVTHGLKGTKVNIVLKKIEEIARHHQMFQIELAESVKTWDEKEEIGGIFAASFSRSMVVDVYSVYVNNFSAAMEEIKTLQSSKQAFKEFLQNTAAKHADRLSIFGLMVKPVQRFPQFIMFMQDLLKYTPQNHHDRCNLQRALTDLENVTYRLNEGKREKEQNFQALHLIKSLNFRLFQHTTPRLIRQDDLQQSESVGGQVKTKTRRVYLLDSTLIVCTLLQREQDGKMDERVKPKTIVGINSLELKESAITPEMKSIIKSGNSKFSIQSKLIDKMEDDMFHLNADLNDMLHDYTVLGQIEQLFSSLKRSYQGLSEDKVHETVCDLQKMIQVKDQQLQLLNSCSIMLQDVVRNVRYIFQTDTPELREEWCKDFLLAKLALDSVNKPGWDISHNSSDEEETVIHQPSMFMKWLCVDMPRNYTKMVCAVPVFLSSSVPSEIGIQHLWVVMTAEKRTQVAIVSTQSSKPVLIESFKATEHEVVAVETVPGYAVFETENAFIEDTVWMSTANSEILVFSLFDEGGRRQSTTVREPRIRFSSFGIAMVMRYTDDRMFVGLSNGILVIYARHYEDGKWNIDSPNIVQLGTTPVNSIINLEEDVWVSCGSTVFIIPMEESAFTETINMTCEDNSEISDMVKSGVGLWVSYKEKSLLHLYHIETKQQLQEINVASAVERMVMGNSGINSDLLSRRCFVTSLMASRGFLWVGTSLGIVLNYQLPRLHDGVPLIHGRANVCFHSHNGPVRFLIPIYCGTVNTWNRAKALDTSTMTREEKSEKNKKENVEGKRNSVFISENKERESVRKSAPLDIPVIAKDLKKNGDPTKLKASEPEELLGGSYEFIFGIKRFRSLENLTTDTNLNFQNIHNSVGDNLSKTKTLTFRRELAQKLQARQNGTVALETAEREISMFYGDLLHNGIESENSLKSGSKSDVSLEQSTLSGLDETKESKAKSDGQKSVKVYRNHPVEIPVTSASKIDGSIIDISKSPDKQSKMAAVKKSLSFQFKHLKKTSQEVRKSASLKITPSSNKHYASLNTIQRRNCNAVVVVSGGDGYTDWRSPLKDSPRHNDASLMFWMYKF